MKRGRHRAAPRAPTAVDLRATLETALRAQQAGRLDEAEAGYRRILAARPDHADALHLLGLVAQQTGRGGEAIALIGRAIAAAPGVARYHGNLALALLQQGRLGEAEARCREALALDPGYVDGLNTLATILKDQGRLDEAIASLRRAVALRPDYAPAHNNLGNILKDRGDFDAALACYARALEIAPDYVAAEFNRGVALTGLGRLDEAEASCRRALALRPDDADAHNNLGNVLRFKGRLDEAAAAYERALELRPDFASARNNLAEFRKFEKDDPGFAALEALKGRDRLAPHEAISLRFALGKMYADIGDHDRAFANYREGNVLRAHEAARQGRVFRADEHARYVDAVITTFGADFFARAASGGAESDRPVFIVGMPRSGTSLVEQILASHPQVYGAGELPEIGLIAGRIAGQTGSAYPVGAAALDATTRRRLGEAYLERVAAAAGDARRVTDKLPANFLHLGLIALILPGARVVHCRRDPRDTCLSCYFHDFYQGNEFSNDLADLGAYWRDYRRLMTHWRETLPLAVIDVDYEALVADQEAESRRLVAFCGLEWDARCLDFHKTERTVRTSSTLQVRKAIFTGSVGRWRAYASHLAPLNAALGEGEDENGPAPP
ncbi:MAG: sulfotransferase [Alphaproteobacteria bacterium]